MKTIRILLLIAIVLLSILLFRTFKSDYKYPDHIIISDTEAIQKQKLYLENQYLHINKNFQDLYPNAKADYTQFTIEWEDLKAYMQYAEKKAAEKKYIRLGLRINLGAKKDSETQVPYTDIFYYTVGDTVGKGKLEDFKKIKYIQSGNRVLCGGHPPKLLTVYP